MSANLQLELLNTPLTKFDIHHSTFPAILKNVCRLDILSGQDWDRC